MGESLVVVMKEFCQIFRAYVVNRRHRPLTFLCDFTELLDACLPCCRIGLFQRSPVRNPLSTSSMFTIAGTTIYFLLSRLN
jgi:hypothetical protein